jgi:two-component system LytT family response regulator
MSLSPPDSNVIRTVIVDDEPPARAKLRRLLGEAEGFSLVGEAGTGIEAVNLILREKPALAFLDISMPDINGFDVAKALPEETRPQLVFVTAHDDRALEAFEVHAIDYLLKPVDPDRFFAMLQRVRRLESPKVAAVNAVLESVAPPQELPKRFLLTEGDRAVFVAPQEIDRAESARNYVVVHARGQRFILRSTLDDFLARLDREHFARMNRSHIVNLDFVSEMVAVGHGEYRVKLKDGTDLVWSRRYAPGSAGA